jgi:hypothetical protein
MTREIIRRTVPQMKKTTRIHPPLENEKADIERNPAVEAIWLGSPRPWLHRKTSYKKARAKKVPEMSQKLRKNVPSFRGVLMRLTILWTLDII